ncbi:unnamed protein product [Rodentolepis nana]|uniref:BK_channel_a domain-containing protein n=1 Tax=Rodentolepis nana TaxID=102285 RepID=A0A0R3TKG5_RODNA|nr:unnamed protein product [Rodentolepis nana]
MNHIDLERVDMTHADACLILADSRAADPAQEDAANIMRVVSVKNYASNVRVIVQLLQQCNKSHLLNIPTWNWQAGDEIVCFSELKLGFLAQSCLAPGFSTLLTNLFSMRSLHGQHSIAGAAIAMEDATMHVTSAQTFTTSTPSVEGNDPDQGIKVPRVRLQSMPNLALRLTENFRKFYTTSIFRGKTDQSTQRFVEAGIRTSSATNLDNLGGQNAQWLSEYLHGVSMELYSARFSVAFDGMTFAEAAKLCMEKLELMLIAILAQSAEEENDGGAGQYPYLAINPPSTPQSTIHERTIGFFICDSQEIASRATWYCIRCHANVKSYNQIHKCACQKYDFKKRFRNLRERISAEISETSRPNSRMVPPSPMGFNTTGKGKMSCQVSTHTSTKPKATFDLSDDNDKPIQINIEDKTIDITGVYYWCQKRTLSEAILPNNRNIESRISDVKAGRILQNHILVCLLADKKAPRLGLRSFVLPLRASNLPASQIRPIVFLTSHEFISEEWHELENFPEVYFLPGSPLSRRDLWIARIQLVSVCVVIGVSETAQADDPYLLDKEAILCSLNIRALKIPPSLRQSVCDDIAARSSGAEIPLLTALCMDSNIHFLDPDDFETGKADIDIFLTIPFARGLAFTGSVLDALVSTAYFDRNAMTLIRYLVTGGTTPVLEQWAVYGGDFYDNVHFTDAEEVHVNEFLASLRRNNTKRPTIAQLSFNDPQLMKIMENYGSAMQAIAFGTLFCKSLEDTGILCLGLFRLNAPPSTPRRIRTSTSSLNKNYKPAPIVRRASACSPPMPVKMRILFEERDDLKLQPERRRLVDRMNMPLGPNSANNRFVITNPPYNFPVHASDLVYCLLPST